MPWKNSRYTFLAAHVTYQAQVTHTGGVYLTSFVCRIEPWTANDVLADAKYQPLRIKGRMFFRVALKKKKINKMSFRAASGVTGDANSTLCRAMCLHVVHTYRVLQEKA